MEKINILYYSKTYNFGDRLSPFIVENLLNKNKYTLVHNEKQQNNKHNIIAIGSYIEAAKENNVIIWGSGAIHRKIKFNKNIIVKAVRGPITEKILKIKNIRVPNIYGDPALLLPKFYTPNIIPSLKDKILVIPHKNNFHHYENAKIPENMILISPMEEWKIVVDSIVSCEAVLSESLHGLIVSDAYNKPNLWLYEHGLTYGTMKFYDYFKSQGRPEIQKIDKIQDFDINKCYKEGNKINLEPLIESFPFK